MLCVIIYSVISMLNTSSAVIKYKNSQSKRIWLISATNSLKAWNISNGTVIFLGMLKYFLLSQLYAETTILTHKDQTQYLKKSRLSSFLINFISIFTVLWIWIKPLLQDTSYCTTDLFFIEQWQTGRNVQNFCFLILFGDSNAPDSN